MFLVLPTAIHDRRVLFNYKYILKLYKKTQWICHKLIRKFIFIHKLLWTNYYFLWHIAGNIRAGNASCQRQPKAFLIHRTISPTLLLGWLPWLFQLKYCISVPSLYLQMSVLSNLPCIHVSSPTVLLIGDEGLSVVMSIENVALVFQVF